MELYNLTSPQKNIESLESFYKGTSITNLCGAVIFDELLNREFLLEACLVLISRHEALHLRFKRDGQNTFQYVHEGNNHEIEIYKFSSYDEMREFGEKQAHTPFNFIDSQMFRIFPFEVSEKTGIMLCISHMICDAWTFSILARDVYDIYKNLCNGKGDFKPVYDYTEFIKKTSAYLESEKYKSDCTYWKEKYSKGVEETPIRISHKKNNAVESKRFTTHISSVLCNKAEMFCRENYLSIAQLFEAAVILYLAKINRENRAITIGIPVLGRSGVRERNTSGMFVYTLPLTQEVDENETVISLCQKTRDTHMEIFRHSKLTFSDIFRRTRENTGFRGRLFDCLVSCQNAKTDIPARTVWFSNGYCETPVVFHFDNRDNQNNYTLTIDYQTDVFPQDSEIELLAKRIIHILGQFISDRDMLLKDISILPDDEYHMLIHEFNKTDISYPKDMCVHDAFSQAAKKHPEDVAIVFRNKKYTYKQLDDMSNALSHFLHDNGIRTGSVVPIISRRSPYFIIAMLGILKSGGAYLPISPDFPTERIEYMIESVGADVVLTCGCSCYIAKEIKLEVFDYSYTSDKTLPECSYENICYVIFTSGSTGKPKGAAITHRNVINYCSANELNVAGKIITDNEKRIVSVTDFVFDIFVTESILALLNNIVIFLADEAEATSQKALAGLIQKNKIRIIQTTPTKMRSFLFDKNELDYLSVLSTIILGGEELPLTLCEEIREHTHAKLINIYGPTETTVWSSFSYVTDNEITIGRPMANTRIYVLDESKNPVPVGIVGEIYISGSGVCKGYINNDTLTDEKYLPDPFFKGTTMYRTGDMGLIRSDGSIIFMGRKDYQIKLRGLRIELGEIESVIGNFSDIELTAVLCKSTAAGEKYLVGYYTSRKEINEKDLRKFISEKLPSYMMPNLFIHLTSMPLTPGGKIDRNALPSPDSERHFIDVSEREFAAPENETEKSLCEIASRILGITGIGTMDDFFELGGDSFSVIAFSALAEEQGISFDPKSVYEHRTIKKLCQSLDRGTNQNTNNLKYGSYPAERRKRDLKLFRLFEKLSQHLYNFKVSGMEELDFNSKYILCPNHESDLDCMWVLSAISDKIHLNETCALIAAEHLEKNIPRSVFRINGGIPIDRKGNFLPAIKRAEEVIKNQKQILIIHPEGTRTRTGGLGEFKKGAALISKETGISIVPVCIMGAREIFPVNKKMPHIFNIKEFKKYSITICFGTPVNPFEKTEEQINEEIKKQIINMRKAR